MYTDRNMLTEYPFEGCFFTMSDTMPPDGDMLGDSDFENVEITEVQRVPCDIQATNKLIANAGSYLDVYFPFDMNEGVKVRIGHKFKCDNWYRPVEGRVMTLVPCQMGGCVCQVKEVGIDIDE